MLTASTSIPAEAWQKAHKSGVNGGCVEVAFMSDFVAVRDSKHRDQPPLIFTWHEWDLFEEALTGQQFRKPQR